MNGNNHRQVYKPISTHTETRRGWLFALGLVLSIVLGCLGAAVLMAWWLS